MPEPSLSSRLPLTALERPRCPKCEARMTLTRVARGAAGFDVRTFDCARCDHAQIVTVATDPMKSDSAGWQHSGLQAPK